MYRIKANILMFACTVILYKYIKLFGNYVNNLSDNEHVRSKIYQEFYHSIVYIANERSHIRIVVTFTFTSCNTNPKKPSPVKMVIAGADGYINSVLRPYVEQFSAKPPDWQGYVRFLVIPFGKYVNKIMAQDNLFSEIATLCTCLLDFECYLECGRSVVRDSVSED